jgi:radical SAM enzyme (TIGR01210 family)
MNHNPNEPLRFWFQESSEGLILFIVFYSMACRYGKCMGCNLFCEVSQKYIDYEHLMAQTDYTLENKRVLDKAQLIKKVIVSNNGSVLDQDTFPSMALMYLIAMLGRNLPNLKILSLETRPEYVDAAELEFLSRAKEESGLKNIEIAIGFEAFDDYIRNTKFRKNISLEVFEKFVDKVVQFDLSIKCYFMLKPVPGMSNKDAVLDIRRAIRYLANVSQRKHAKINLHLNPTFAAKGTLLEEELHKGRYEPPHLIDAVKAILPAENTPISVFIGLDDEGLAAIDGSFLRPGEEALVKELEKFNQTQDYEILKKILHNPHAQGEHYELSYG